MRATDRQNKIIAEFQAQQDWESKYKLIIEKSKNLKSLAEDQKTADLIIKGCQSQVWLKAELSPNDEIIFLADSDALVVKGLIALLLEVFSNLTPDEILNTKPDFLKEINLGSHLSPSRANGLNSMLKQIYNYALAYSARIKMRAK